MIREVVITPRAKREIKNIFDFIEAKWNIEVKRKLSNKINTCIKLIIKTPELFPISNSNKKNKKSSN
ncbi:type II toxin-antitoxin system RelE/ParE family toxin [Flavobacterium daejeonense]|uniref:type II toxin-antitoxin system RelE/ParE family toxin n=1 Tax=Flavobacterium daejeonense TaxID=350893 RepID=UPI00068C196E|nr:type II toxin-antitoxin system RelE/ParE family toxin [Flavobacterium daejeonense]